MTQGMNAVLVQGVTLADIETMIERTVKKQMEDFYLSIQEKPVTLIKRTEAAKILGVSLPTIDSYAKAGLLHSKRVGGRVFFDEEEITSFRRGKHISPAKQQPFA